MLRTNNIIPDISDIPPEWVFRYYLGIKEPLTGQRIKMHSVFNEEKTPSMHIFFNTQIDGYVFKDFSSGNGGDGIALVQKLHKLEHRGAAVNQIRMDFKKFTDTNGDCRPAYELMRKELVPENPWKVTEFIPRQWMTKDMKFWMSFEISSKTLEFYRIKPLTSYKMEKVTEEGIEQLEIEHDYIYGYFRLDGTLYKIYQPYVKKKKFIKVRDYIQGTDQLTFKKPYLVITKALKDICCLSVMDLPCEFVAPDAEKVLIKPDVINSYMHKYKGICTLMDNDRTGLEAMQQYFDEYDIPPVYLNLEKDTSDSVRRYGRIRVREKLHKLLADTLIYGNFTKPQPVGTK